MNFQIISDLHLESPPSYTTFAIPRKAPYLALLGDIGNLLPHKTEYLAFLTTQLHSFRAVLFVPGSHDSYHATWAETLLVLRTFESEIRQKRKSATATPNENALGEFILLDRGTFRPLDDPIAIILGCSLFTHIPPSSKTDVAQATHDFHAGLGTQNWTVEAHNAAHARDPNWLNARVTEVVILTH